MMESKPRVLWVKCCQKWVSYFSQKLCSSDSHSFFLFSFGCLMSFLLIFFTTLFRFSPLHTCHLVSVVRVGSLFTVGFFLSKGGFLLLMKKMHSKCVKLGSHSREFCPSNLLFVFFLFVTAWIFVRGDRITASWHFCGSYLYDCCFSLWS